MVDIKAVKAVYEGALKLKKGERCLIVTDTVKEPIARVFYEYAKDITGHADIEIMEPTGEHGQEPPERIAKAMLEYDVELLITAKSLTHTLARRNATQRGARIATMPSITEEIINRCLAVDYNKLKESSNNLYETLKGASRIRVITEKGTDILFKTGPGEFFGKDGGSFDYPGAFGNLPEGEVAFSPEDCNGKYVVDASFPDLGLLEQPITFEVKECKVTSITGFRSEEIVRRLDEAGEKAYRVAELGIGLNPSAKVTGNILEDEKAIGTVHIAVGNDLSFGGDNDVPLHLDGVINKPDIYIDDILLMNKGKFIPAAFSKK